MGEIHNEWRSEQPRAAAAAKPQAPAPPPLASPQAPSTAPAQRDLQLPQNEEDLHRAAGPPPRWLLLSTAAILLLLFVVVLVDREGSETTCQWTSAKVSGTSGGQKLGDVSITRDGDILTVTRTVSNKAAQHCVVGLGVGAGTAAPSPGSAQ